MGRKRAKAEQCKPLHKAVKHASERTKRIAIFKDHFKVY